MAGSLEEQLIPSKTTVVFPLTMLSVSSSKLRGNLETAT